jgi:hypothetical protein
MFNLIKQLFTDPLEEVIKQHDKINRILYNNFVV